MIPVENRVALGHWLLADDEPLTKIEIIELELLVSPVTQILCLASSTAVSLLGNEAHIGSRLPLERIEISYLGSTFRH